MKHDLETLGEVIEAMPIYGKLRETNEHLTFGQYLTILKEWFEALRSEKEDLVEELQRIKDLHASDHPVGKFIEEVLRLR